MKQTPFILKKTADGSDTLYSQKMKESYHSVNGAVQESMHVFIKGGLRQLKKETIKFLKLVFPSQDHPLIQSITRI
jgi:hypothetical protein